MKSSRYAVWASAAVMLAVVLLGLGRLVPAAGSGRLDARVRGAASINQQTGRRARAGRQQAARQRRQQQRRQQGQSVPPPTAEEGGVPVLSAGDSYDDFASVAQTSDGTLYAAYAAYYDGHDQIRLHQRLPDGQWSARTYVPLVEQRPDIWMPQLAVDAQDRLWVIWCEQVGREKGTTGNWDLYARYLHNDTWSPAVRLSDDPGPDINPHVTTDANHNIYVVWQAHPEQYGNVMLSRFDGNEWTKPVAITQGKTSDWFPQVAVDAEGTAWIAFDTYRNGDYDVMLTSYDGSTVGAVVPIATSKYYEAHASVACTPDGRVWVAWEQGGYHWGKDQGYWLRIQQKNVGTSLGSARTVQVAAYDGNRLQAAPAVASVMPEGERRFLAMAGLATDGDGRLWLRVRHRKQTGGRRYWTEHVTYLTDEGWKAPMELAGSAGRISVFSRMLAGQDGTMYVAYSSDGRRQPNFHQPRRDRVLVASLPEPEEAAEVPELADYEPPPPPEGARDWDLARDAEQVQAIRAQEIEIDGQRQQIVRGDLHRHTELSWDVGPGNDGSYLDFYRYMIDVAAMDFGAITDHQGGGHYAYHWWLTEKSADMFYLPPRFVPLYGYERSVSYPNGHRNVFHSYRGVPVFPFQLKAGQRGVFPGVGTGAVVENDTKLLYGYLHGSGGVAISHTSGTNMGTDWRDNDPEIEPVVEIYQGARNSYEVLGGPRVHDPENPPTDPPGGFRPAGMLWNAWAKGYRLGTITSSDHGSTHISYALVYTPRKDREAILEAIRKRHTYGATDNLIVEFRANGHFMGEEFTTSERPTLALRVKGTDTIARVDLIRDNKYIYHTEPDKSEVAIEYLDMQPQSGTNMYYFRVVQEGGEVAWSSPVWVDFQGGSN